MKNISILLLVGLAAAAQAQYVGTTKLLSTSPFCKKYGCHYVKKFGDENSFIATYYISDRFNFDSDRNADPKASFLSKATLRFVGGVLKNSDTPIMKDFVFLTAGVNIDAQLLLKCGISKSVITLYKFPTKEGYLEATCHRVDADEVNIEVGNYSEY